VKLQAAAQLTEQLIKKCVKGLATLPQETQWWLRSAQQTDINQQPLARLQNLESQATYASYMVWFVCFYLRIIVDEERRVNKYLLQRDQVHNSSKELGSKDAGTESEYNNSDNDDDADSNDNSSVVLQRQPHKNMQTNKMKDARELFS
jgi:hypothetical protein